MTVKNQEKTAETAFDEASFSLSYLQAELARVDILIQREVRRWQSAGQDPYDDYRGMYVSDAEVAALLKRPFATSWGQTVELTADEAELFQAAEAQVQAVVTTMNSEGQTPRLRQLVETFGLNPFERDVLLVCLAPAFDSRYERLYGYLQDNVNRRRPTVRLILNLLGQPGRDQFLLSSYFVATAPLFNFELLTHLTEPGTANPHWINQTLQPDETVVAWLMGHYQPAAALERAATLRQPELTPTDELLSAEAWPQLNNVIANQPIIVFHGLDQTAQQATAHRIAADQNRTLLTVDLAAVIDSDVSPRRAVSLALRDARLTQAIPYLTGWTACFSGGGKTPPAEVMQAVCDYPGLIIIAGKTTWQANDVDRRRRLLWCAFPKPAYPQRQALWRHFLTQAGLECTPEVSGVAGQFILTSGQIRDAAATALDLTFARNKALGMTDQESGTISLTHSPLSTADLFTAARTHSSPRLSGLARKITPRYDWDDIILPADQKAILRELVATVRGRPQVLETWEVGQKLASSSGVTALFAGPPGTGKTMSAEVIAGELKLDLYKIDLSSVVSKYIGETEKNLERIFSEAESSNAILFFDEADALFGKRSEVKDSHDRYANIEISYLLQRMETYDGVTILATNLGGNMDEAFTRRLQFVVDFPMPSAADQKRIWESLLPAGVPRQADLNFSLLTERFDLAGGNIRNILVNAAFLAAADGGQVTMAHLLHGTRRELQKMGRLLDEEELRIS
ncbi:MAG: ATP-binding protein [Anaerolineaceae bacterium]|nr:ATP-binding protein [Anaerolineaceae bacterium]